MTWSSMSSVTTLVDLVKNLAEALLGLLPCLHDGAITVLGCCELGSSLLQLKPKCSLSVLGIRGSLYGLGQQCGEGSSYPAIYEDFEKR